MTAPARLRAAVLGPVCLLAIAAGGAAGPLAATVAGRPIPLAEVDARCGAKCTQLARGVAEGERAGTAALSLHRLRAELYRERQEQIGPLIDEALWQSEADARGTTVRALRAEVDATAPPVSDADVARFYTERVKPGSREAEKRGERIRPYLRAHAERAAEDAFVSGLRERYEVRILLLEPAPPRVALGAGAGGFRGPADASVKIIFLSAYRGSSSRRMWNVARELAREPGVALAVRPLLAPREPAALDAAATVRCAGEQRRFWEAQEIVANADEPPARAALAEIAAQLTLDSGRFAACLDSAPVRDAIWAESAEAERLGIDGAPTLLIDGLAFGEIESIDHLREVVAAERAASASAARTAEEKPPP